MTTFLHMGGYAAYVWTCMGLALAVLAWNVASARSQHARARERALGRVAAGRGGR
jgi:heme exporter protein CcmD